VAEENSDDAAAVVRQYGFFSLGEVKQLGNTVLAATVPMSDEERSAIQGCLEAAQ
jgi:hypothetical protein